jgi:hypothetical protein
MTRSELRDIIQKKCSEAVETLPLLHESESVGFETIDILLDEIREAAREYRLELEEDESREARKYDPKYDRPTWQGPRSSADVR